MKTFAIAAVATVCLSVSSVSGMKSYLTKLPNGDKFAQALGHTDDSYSLSAFATAFLAADLTWTADFCNQKFPGSSITNGEAFGDPCCVWKSGPAAKSVSAFTTNPGAGVGKCAGAATTKPPSAPATPKPNNPAPVTPKPNNPAPVTPKPNNPAPVTPKPNNTPKPNPNPAPRPNPAPKPTTKKPAKNCKRNLRK